MAYLRPEDEFIAENIDLPIIGIASDMSLHDSGFHQHDYHTQILYAPSGCMTLVSDKVQVVLPPSKLLIIPPKVRHRVTFRNVVAYRSIYIRDRDFELPSMITVLSVNSLFREVIERICYWEWKEYSNENINLLKVFWDEFNSSTISNYSLSIPNDYRIKDVIEKYLLHEEIPPFLNELAQQVGASEKTISRIFKKETGMSYQNWRLQWRLFRAIELLAEQKTIGEITDELNFSSDSAFIDFFKKQTGVTPNKYVI